MQKSSLNLITSSTNLTREQLLNSAFSKLTKLPREQLLSSAFSKLTKLTWGQLVNSAFSKLTNLIGRLTRPALMQLIILLSIGLCSFTAGAIASLATLRAEELLSYPLGLAENQLGLAVERGNSSVRYTFPAACVVHNGQIYVMDSYNCRIVIFDEKGQLRRTIPLPEAEYIIDMVADSEGNLYLISYFANKLYIYRPAENCFETITGWNRPHILEVFSNYLYVIDYDPKTQSDLRNQWCQLPVPGSKLASTFNSPETSCKIQYTLDLDIYQLFGPNNQTINFKVNRTLKDQVMWDYEVETKKSDGTLSHFRYTPETPKGLIYKNIRLIGITPDNRLCVLIQTGPILTPQLSFDEIIDQTASFVDLVDVATGTVIRYPLEKDLALYGPGLTAHRFFLDEMGNLYQVQLTDKLYRVIKYTF